MRANAHTISNDVQLDVINELKCISCTEEPIQSNILNGRLCVYCVVVVFLFFWIANGHIYHVKNQTLDAAQSHVIVSLRTHNCSVHRAVYLPTSHRSLMFFFHLQLTKKSVQRFSLSRSLSCSHARARFNTEISVCAHSHFFFFTF